MFGGTKFDCPDYRSGEKSTTARTFIPQSETQLVPNTFLPTPPNAIGGYTKGLWQTRVTFRPGDKNGQRRMRRNGTSKKEMRSLKSTTKDSFTKKEMSSSLPMVVATRPAMEINPYRFTMPEMRGGDPKFTPKNAKGGHQRTSSFTDPKAPTGTYALRVGLLAATQPDSAPLHPAPGQPPQGLLRLCADNAAGHQRNFKTFLGHISTPATKGAYVFDDFVSESKKVR